MPANRRIVKVQNAMKGNFMQRGQYPRRIEVYLTEKQRAAIDSAAERDGLKPATWARAELLKAAARSEDR